MNIFRKWTIYFVSWLFVINRHILCHFKLNFSSAILAITEWKNRNSQHNGYQWEGGDLIAPVAETGLSHRLTSYKILGHSLDYHIGKYRWIIRSEVVFFSFQFHARMLSSEVSQSLKSYEHFSGLGVGISLSHRNVGFFISNNTSIHSLGEDDTSRDLPAASGTIIALICASATSLTSM